MSADVAVGTISMGIQVCEDLIKYYKSWKDYEDDIREAYDEIAGLSTTLNFLYYRLKTLTQNALATRTTDCVLKCRESIQKLDDELKRFPQAPPAGLRQKLEAGGRHLMYPLRKSTLKQLKEIVQGMMRQLDTVIQFILLDSSQSIKDTVVALNTQTTSIESIVNATSIQTTSIRDTVDATRAQTTTMKDTVGDTRVLVTRIEATTLDTQKQSTAIAAGVRSILSSQESVELNRILGWLSAPDPSTNHAEARKEHEPGTGEWLFESQEYNNWVTGSSPRFWLHGKAGCCKAILCSTIIEDVSRRISGQDGVVLLYFYFSFSALNKQNYTNLLSSMVTQLSRGCTIHPLVRDAYAQTQPNSPSAQVLENILVAFFEKARMVYLVIDALGECPERQREEVIVGFKRVTQVVPNIRLLITSRREADIEELIASWCQIQLPIDEAGVNRGIDVL